MTVRVKESDSGTLVSWIGASTEVITFEQNDEKPVVEGDVTIGGSTSAYGRTFVGEVSSTKAAPRAKA